MERELTPGLIPKLPADAIRNIALSLSLEDVNHWCQTSKKFKDIICNNSTFWYDKLKRDYSNIDISGLSREQMKYKYQALYLRTATLIDTTSKWESDPRTKEINKEQSDIDRQIAILNERRDELSREKYKISREYAKQAKEKTNELQKLEVEALKHLSRTPGNFYDFVVDDATFGTIDTLTNRKKPPSSIWKQLMDSGVIEPKSRFHPGDLVGLRRKDSISLPEILIYFYTVKSKGKNAIKYEYEFNDAEDDFTFPEIMYTYEGPYDYIAWKYNIPISMEKNIKPSESDEEEQSESDEENEFE